MPQVGLCDANPHYQAAHLASSMMSFRTSSQPHSEEQLTEASRPLNAFLASF